MLDAKFAVFARSIKSISRYQDTLLQEHPMNLVKRCARLEVPEQSWSSIRWSVC